MYGCATMSVHVEEAVDVVRCAFHLDEDKCLSFEFCE